MTILNTIPAQAFEYSTDIRSYTVPGSVRSIGKYAFSGSTLERIVIPEGVRRIEDYAFSGSMLREVILPDSLESLGSGVFKYCRLLTGIVFPKSMELIPKEICYDCGRLKDVTLPDDAYEIGIRSFTGCTALEEIDLPDSLEIIRSNAFSQCISLKSAVLPDSLKKIERAAFSYCSALKEMTFKESFEELGGAQFFQDQALEDLRFEGVLKNREILKQKDLLGHCFSLQRITAPRMIPADFGKGCRKQAVLGFAGYYASGGSCEKEVLDEYISELRDNISSYRGLLLSDTDLLQFVTSLGILGPDETEALMPLALQCSDTEIKTLFLDYENTLAEKSQPGKDKNDALDQLLNDLF